MKFRINSTIQTGDHALVNQLAKGTFSLTKRPRSFILGFLYSVFFYFIGVFAFIPRILLRTKLGERTIGVITVLSVYCLIWAVNVLYSIIPELVFDLRKVHGESPSLLEVILMTNVLVSNPEEEITWMLIFVQYFNDYGLVVITPALKWFWYIILILSILQFLEFKSRKNDELVHSFYRGDSVFFSRFIGMELLGYQINQITVWMVIEPLFVVILSIAFQYIFKEEILSSIIRFSAIALFIEEWRIWSENKSIKLDIADSNIDSLYISSVQKEVSNDASKDTVGKATIL
jgi:hypothetical protein